MEWGDEDYDRETACFASFVEAMNKGDAGSDKLAEFLRRTRSYEVIWLPGDTLDHEVILHFVYEDVEGSAYMIGPFCDPVGASFMVGDFGY